MEMEMVNPHRYPVIDPNPTFSKVISNINRDEYIGVTSLAGLFGSVLYLDVNHGHRPSIAGIRGITMASGCYLLFGIPCVFKNSADRLMGFLPNDHGFARLNKREMKKMKTDCSPFTPLERVYPIIDRNPTFSKVIRKFNRRDYFNMTVLAGIGSSLYAIHAATHGPAMKRGVAYLSCGGLFGFIIAFSESLNRLMGLSPNDYELARLNKRELEQMNTYITASTKRGYPVISNAHVTVSSLFMSFAALIVAQDINRGFRISSLVTSGLVFGATYAHMKFASRLLCFHDEMNTKYPVVDSNPDFSKVVGNFNTLDYLRIPATTGFSVIAGHHFGMKKPVLRSLVTIGLLGLVFGFGYSYMESTGRLMGVFPNDGEVARFNKK